MKIGVLEDEKKVSGEICKHLTRYFESRDMKAEITVFNDAFDLIENYGADYAVLFMDIQLPVMSGMEAARKIRETDPQVIIVFVTNLAQYAVDGYGVNAFDFILKPVDYNSFALKLDRICKELAHRITDDYINVKTKQGFMRINISEIYYVEVKIHDLIIHTSAGQAVTRGTMKTIANDLGGKYFSLCNSCYLVNLAHVRLVNKNVVLSNGEELTISQGKRKQFMIELAKYAGDTI